MLENILYIAGMAFGFGTLIWSNYSKNISPDEE